MRDDGERLSRGQLDRRAVEIQAFRDSLFAVAIFGGVILISGVLAILLIEFFQSIGWWEVPASGAAEDATARVTARLRLRIGLGT